MKRDVVRQTAQESRSIFHEISCNFARRFPLYGVEADGLLAKTAQPKEASVETADMDNRTNKPVERGRRPAQHNHRSQCERSTSVAHADVLDHPRGSVLPVMQI